MTLPRDLMQQFDYDPGITVAKPETLLDIRERILDHVAALPPLIAQLALKTDDPADTARILIAQNTETIAFFVERLLRELKVKPPG